jgi:hypothetical protein
MEEAKHASVLQALMANLEAAAAAEKELRRELMEDYNDESLLGAARKLLTGEELEEALRVPSLGSIGSSCSSVGELGPRRRRDMGKVVGMLMGRILEIAFAGEKKDPRKVLEAALERRGLGDTALGVAMAMAQEGGYEKEVQSKLAVAAGPYQACIKSEDCDGAQRILSMVADLEGVTDEEVRHAVSEGIELKVGDRVRVASSGSTKLTATLLELEGDDGMVLVSERHDGRRRGAGDGARERGQRVARWFRPLHALRGAAGEGTREGEVRGRGSERAHESP